MKDIERIAIHEAGHAVALLDVGRIFLFATIEPTDEYLGRVMTNDAGNETDVWLAMAGPAAESRLAGDPVMKGCEGDWNRAASVAKAVCGERWQFLILHVERELKFWLNSPHVVDRIRVLADALLCHRTLNFSAAKKVLADHASSSSDEAWRRQVRNALARHNLKGAA